LPNAPSQRNNRAYCFRGIVVVLAAAGALAIGAWTGRQWLLLSVAHLWIVADPIGPADAAAVFGGGAADRPFAAAQYYRQGLIKKILVDSPDSEAILLSLGTPASAIETFGTALRNTHQETLALRDWAKRHDMRSIIVPTEIFPTRRVYWMLHRAFPSTFVIRVIALDPPNYHRDDWWLHRQGVIAFKTEIIKYLYYVLAY
jgi:uncharacterized SAM-binding protein YcdF (DUF218 family)